ncbi:branched-chain amino acid aminotransferase [Rhizobium leguminosarum]|nr:branched-chain amino acid aminotransferase [Rhizobium leguminosarum]
MASKSRSIEVIERAILPEELPGFSECFFTGSAAEVTPVPETGPYRFTPSTISEMNDYMKEVYPAVIAAE